MERNHALRRQHIEIVTLMNEMKDRLIVDSLRRDARDVRGMLSILAGKITVHLVMEDKGLYPRLAERGDGVVAETAKRFQEEMGGIRDAFLRYLDRWPTNVDIERDAAEFARDTKIMLRTIELRIEREEAEIYPLLDGKGLAAVARGPAIALHPPGGMLGWTFSCKTAEEVATLLRALGKHRYVAEVDHRIHWMIDAVLSDREPFATHDAAFQARREREPELDASSYDPSLWRPASVDEVAAALAAFWTPEAEGVARRAALVAMVLAEGLEVPTHAPFEGDPDSPDHPLLVQLAWRLFPVAELDPERHAGAIRAMEEAREEVDVSAPIDQEGPDLGVAELVGGAPRGVLVSDFVVWADGSYAYNDYVFRGASKVAKLPDPPIGDPNEG